MAKPKGFRGSWFAEWKGVQYPCVHKVCTTGQWPHYTDAGINDHPSWPAFIEAIQTGKTVILTTDYLKPDGSAESRKDYVGLFTVDNVEVRGNELHFDFVTNLGSFR